MEAAQSRSNLSRRQSSLPDDQPTSGNSSTSLNIEATSLEDVETGNDPGNTPLLLSETTTPSNNATVSTAEKQRYLVDVALSFCLLLAGSSIVPLFAAAENEAWRTQNIPYQQTKAGDVMLDFELNQPLVDPPTISSNFLTFTSVMVPLLIVLTIHFVNIEERKFLPVKAWNRRQWQQLRSSICSLFVSVGLSEGVTCTLKLYVSRHRPNFYALCGFDPTQLKCTAPLNKVHEASLSFPSGHSSLSFCGMTFLLYFFLARVTWITPTTSLPVPGGRGVLALAPYQSLLGVLACMLPWSYSFFVASSRIVDKWHHPSDVLAGILIGIAAATIGYHAFFPCVLSANTKPGIPRITQQSLPSSTSQPSTTLASS